jgi:hypothetical protein
MKNSDMPAMPSKISVNREADEPQAFQFGNNDFVSPGLTKREYIAAMAMQGLLTAASPDGTWSGISAAADQAVVEADALLAALEES